MTEIIHAVTLRRPHETQRQIRDSPAKRKIIRAGRRGGKTVIAATICVEKFLQGLRPLYAAPTSDQLETFWFEVKKALQEPIDAGVFKKNETDHTIELHGTKQRIKGKTAWDSNTLRGDYTDYLVLDEFQLMNEDTWGVVGAPMLLDNNGDALFIYTPPSLSSRSITKARDPQHAANMFQKAQQDSSGRWAAFHFTSFDNPHISKDALNEITEDMTNLAYRQEILAEDVEEVPGALWTRKIIDNTRATSHPDLTRIVVGVDPSGSQHNETGIVVAGKSADGHGYVLDDKSLLGSPGEWADAVLTAYNRNDADMVVAEVNFGGDMCEATITRAADATNQTCRYKNVHASRGKAVRAEPIVAQYEHGKIHHVGGFSELEGEMVTWVPGQSNYSPNRIDALVWALTELFLEHPEPIDSPLPSPSRGAGRFAP
ncbi:MAG: hypothetical protein U9Q37_00980 [Euryarchaeota archaeon]|nr:hypothetical protein [Euryarchaeota archaeon]